MDSQSLQQRHSQRLGAVQAFASPGNQSKLKLRIIQRQATQLPKLYLPTIFAARNRRSS